MNNNQLEKTETKMRHDSKLVIPAMAMPVFRASLAVQDGVERNILIETWGGLGDQACAEPALRFALNNMKGCDVSLASEAPYLFEHLKFKKVFDLRETRPIYENYMVFRTIVPPTDLVWQFFSHCLTNCVDFASMCAYRMQLPVKDRELLLYGKMPKEMPEELRVVVHPGRHWPSKTFPKDWWDAVLSELIRAGIRPVIIGANTDDNRGTVDVDTTGCIDLRNKTSVMETVYLLHSAWVVLTNDSAPLHLAAAGSAWIGYVATCKHPDYITHWRQGQWGYRMQNLGKGGMWDVVPLFPNREEDVTVEHCDADLLRSWLPEPADVAAWTLSKLGESNESPVSRITA